MAMTHGEIKVMLRDLLERDPDGKRTKPTSNDYTEFKDYVIRKYGQEGWKIYRHKA